MNTIFHDTMAAKVEDLRHLVAPGSRASFERSLKPIRQLRNRLVHGMPPLDEDCDILRDHVVHAQQLTKAKDVAWLAEVVDRMERWIEAVSSSVVGAR